ITNNGPDDAVGVYLRDSLPDGLTLDSTDGASCSRDGDIYCRLGDILAKETVTVRLYVHAETPGTFTDTATVSSQNDPNLDNNSAGTATASDFALAVKAGSPDPAQFDGDSEGTQVTLDAGSYAVSQETALGYYTTLSPDCEGTIAPGQSKTCTVSNVDLAPIK